ncbi:MAG: hypothetical protein DMG39_12500 [Acidobacteria bacterium]|nr:MAG: hypothetical protein DMG39_12500 [Acidobacteriota bacterium]
MVRLKSLPGAMGAIPARGCLAPGNLGREVVRGVYCMRSTCTSDGILLRGTDILGLRPKVCFDHGNGHNNQVRTDSEAVPFCRGGRTVAGKDSPLRPSFKSAEFCSRSPESFGGGGINQDRRESRRGGLRPLAG